MGWTELEDEFRRKCGESRQGYGGNRHIILRRSGSVGAESRGKEKPPTFTSYSEQKIVAAWIDDYAYLVPYSQDGEELFLKTIIPSRKATSKYKRK